MYISTNTELYNALVQLHLAHACIIWVPQPYTSRRIVEKVQQNLIGNYIYSKISLTFLEIESVANKKRQMENLVSFTWHSFSISTYKRE